MIGFKKCTLCVFFIAGMPVGFEEISGKHKTFVLLVALRLLRKWHRLQHHYFTHRWGSHVVPNVGTRWEGTFSTQC